MNSSPFLKPQELRLFFASLPHDRRRLFLVVIAALVLLLSFFAWRSVSAATATIVPDTDISSAWPTCSTTCSAMMQYSYVDEGNTPDIADWIGTGLSGGGGEVVEFGLTTTSGVQNVSNVEVCIHAQSASNANGGTLDTVSINLRVGGTLQTATDVTPAFNTWGTHCATFTGSWTQAQLDGMQAHLTRNQLGTGPGSGRDDDIQVATVYATVTYTGASTFEQAAYRWFNNQDVSSDITFSKSYGDTGLNTGVFIDETTDGGYVITGETADGGTSSDMYLAKYDKGGTLSWSKHWGGSGLDVGNVVAQTSDGGYIVTGLTASYGAGANDVLLAKYDSSGNLSWNTTWGTSANDVGRAVVQTSDGGYAVTGFTTVNGADLLLLKYDSTGTLTWSTMWGAGSGSLADRGHSLKQTSDGGYIVSGETASFGAGGLDVALLKFDSTGTLQWNRTWGGTGTDSGRRVITTSDGGYAVGGYTTSFGGGLNDLFLAKFDSTGALAWSKTWGGASEDYGYSLAQTSDDGFILVGDTASFGSGVNDVNIVRYDSTGTMLWNTVWGGTGGDLARDAVQTADGGYAVVGNAESYGVGGHDIVLQKYSSNGTMAGCSPPLCQTPTATETSPTDATLDPAATTATPTGTVGAPTAGGGTQSFTATTVVGLYPQINVSTPLAATNTVATTPAAGTPFRLRMNLHVDQSDAGQNSSNFKLQVASRGADNICDVSFSGETYNDITPDSGAIRFFNNPSSYDTQSLAGNVNDPTHSGHANILQTYEETNGFTITNTITAGQDGLWDFALVVDASAPDGASYCLRAVSSTGAVLNTYSVIPEITTPVPTINQANYRWYQNADNLNPGAPLAAQDTATSIAPNTPFRLRQLLEQNVGTTQTTQYLKLQYALRSGVCDVGFNGETYVDFDAGTQDTGLQATATNGSSFPGNSTGFMPWGSPANALSDNGANASTSTTVTSSTQTSYTLSVDGYGLTVPSEATIEGVEVVVEASGWGGGSSYLDVRLDKNSGTSSSTRGGTTNLVSESGSLFTYGSSTDMWGLSLTPTEVNDSSFAVHLEARLRADTQVGQADAYVDYAAVKVYYSMPSSSDIQYYVNGSVSHGATINSAANDPVPSQGTVIYQSYNSAVSVSTPAAISAGENGLWDFSLISSGAAENNTYCFRLVKSDGAPLASYSFIPEITISAGGGPVTPTLNQQLRGGQSVIDGIKRGFLW